MKTIAFLFAFALPLSLGSAASAATFEEANQLYDREQYAQAKAAYESVIAEGTASANIFYNLANTEYRLKAPGRAAWNYERALAAEPSHPEAQTNLTMVREQNGARLLPPGLAERALLPWPANFYVIVATAGVWLLVFAGYGIFIRGQRESFRLWALALVAVIAGAYGGLGVWADAARQAIGIVLEREAIARVAPADRAAPVEPLPAGSRVRIISVRGEWTYCELPGHGRGWLPSQSVASLATEARA